jgi:L-ascorbate metabolism protein UlaG (beta-lactamase superfamily)
VTAAKEASVAKSAAVGAAFIADIQSRRVPEAALGIWWLGQASFVIRGGGTTVYLDPYLAPGQHRIVPPAVEPAQVNNADLVLCTHDHGDHVDPIALAGIAKASPRARFLVPGVAEERLLALGIAPERIVVPPIDEPMSFGDLVVTAIPAAHEELDYSPQRGHPYLGYVLKLNGVVAYHSGDCTMYEGLTERLKSHRPDVALLPINGHDWKRTHEGIIGNMTYREAADLAVATGVDLCIPMHYGMFANNTEPPGNFVDYVHQHYPEQHVKVMARYEGFVYLKP